MSHYEDIIDSSRLARAAVVACALVGAIPSLASAQDISVANRNANQFEGTATRADASDEHRLRIQAGGSFVTGNANSVSANVATRYQIRRGSNEGTLEGIMNLGFAVNPMAMAAGYQRNAENYLLRGRYDRYFGGGNNSIFVSPLFFRDTFSGFAARASGQLGYLRVLYNDPGKRKFRGEIGVDGTYEVLQYNAMRPGRCTDGPAMGTAAMPAECGVFAFMGRVFLGYEDNAFSVFTYNAGVETLVNFLGLSTPNLPPDIRINASLGFNVKVSDFFAVGLQDNLRVMVQPVGTNQAVDNSLLITLNFQHSFDAPPPAAPEPPPCPTCPECPASAGSSGAAPATTEAGAAPATGASAPATTDAGVPPATGASAGASGAAP